LPRKRSSLALDADSKALVVRLWREWLRPHLRELILATALMVLVAAATNAYPLLIRYIINLVGQDGLQVGAILPPLILTIVIVTSIRGGALYFQTVVANRIVLKINAEMQKKMFAHLVEADLSQITRQPVGQLISRFTNDLTFVRETLLRASNGLIRDVITVVGLVGVMIYLDPLLALIVLVIYPAAAVPIIDIGRRLRKSSTNTQEHMGNLTSVLNESFAGARMVKTYGLDHYERRRADDTFDGLYKLLMKIVKTRAQIEPLMEILAGLAIGGVIAFGAYRIASGTGTAGDLAGFIGALLMAAQPIRAIGTLNAVLQEGLAAVKRVFELLDEQPTIVDHPDAKVLKVEDGEVRFDNVSFAYGNEPAALSNISLKAKPGQTIALVGPSGAGKSTALNLVPRLYETTEGRVLIDGYDVRSVTLASLREAMAFVSQEVVLFNDTVRANIAFGKLDATEDEVIEAARAAAAHDFIEALPSGYDTLVGDRGTRLSGGQRQRIALARAMLRDARILLLDEATSALDAESESKVQQALGRLTAGRTTIVIAHRLATVRNADRIYVFDEGRIVEEGTHNELFAKDGLYTTLCQLQFVEDASAVPAPPIPTPEIEKVEVS